TRAISSSTEFSAKKEAPHSRGASRTNQFKAATKSCRSSPTPLPCDRLGAAARERDTQARQRCPRSASRIAKRGGSRRHRPKRKGRSPVRPLALRRAV